MDPKQLQEMMAQAQQHAQKMQEQMQQTTVEASAGGGSVTVKMDGQKHLLAVRIDPEVVKTGDVEMLQDLVVAAVNEAGRKADAALQNSMSGMLGGFDLGGLL